MDEIEITELLLKKENEAWKELKKIEKQSDDDSKEYSEAFIKWQTIYNILKDIGFSDYDIEANSR